MAQIIEFLNIWPLPPLFYEAPVTRRDYTLCTRDSKWWSRRADASIAATNARLLEDFEATVYADAPTVPCLERRTFTIHQYLEPPLVFPIGPRLPEPIPEGVSIQPDGEQPPTPDVISWLEHLMSRIIVVHVPGPFGFVNRTVHLWEHLHEVDRGVLGQLGVTAMEDVDEGELLVPIG